MRHSGGIILELVPTTVPSSTGGGRAMRYQLRLPADVVKNFSVIKRH